MNKTTFLPSPLDDFKDYPEEVQMAAIVWELILRLGWMSNEPENWPLSLT
jgi:hypothetical protein